MSDTYSQFDSASNKSGNTEQYHSLKLSLDLHSVRNLQTSANLYIRYKLKLKEDHEYQSQVATPVSAGGHSTELESTFASYDFIATKQ